MNVFIRQELLNMELMADGFLTRCRMAARKDDGTVSREEERQLRDIEKAVADFRRALEKVR